jgi:anti-sigma28 factor (negative regulator of flagellin synthesis)
MDIKTVSTAYGAKLYEAGVKSDRKSEQPKATRKFMEVVAFSDTSLNMKKIKDAVASAPEIRIPLVEEIKQKIANNTYPIDMTAESALDRMLKLGIL